MNITLIVKIQQKGVKPFHQLQWPWPNNGLNYKNQLKTQNYELYNFRNSFDI